MLLVWKISHFYEKYTILGLLQFTIVHSISHVDLPDNFDWTAYLMEGIVLPNYEMGNDEVKNSCRTV